MPTVRVINTGALSCDLITEDQTIARFCRAGTSIDVVLAENQQFHITIYRKVGQSWNITLQALDYPAIHLFRDSFGDLDVDWTTSGNAVSDSPYVRGIFWLAVPVAGTPPPPDTALAPGDLRLNGFFASPPTDTSVRYTVKILNTSATHSGQAIVRVEIRDPSGVTVAYLEEQANFPVSTTEYVKNFTFTGLLPSTTYTAHMLVFSDQPLLNGGPKTFTTLATPVTPPPPVDVTSISVSPSATGPGPFTFTINHTGTPVAYQWMLDGSFLDSVTSKSWSNVNLTVGTHQIIGIAIESYGPPMLSDFAEVFVTVTDGGGAGGGLPSWLVWVGAGALVLFGTKKGRRLFK